MANISKIPQGTSLGSNFYRRYASVIELNRLIDEINLEMPSLSADNTWTGDNSYTGDMIIGDAAGDTLTVNATSTFNENITMGSADIDLDGNKLIFDSDADSYMYSSADDSVDFYLNGALDFTFKANLFIAAAGSVINTDTINETTPTSGVTIDSVLLKDSTVKVGAGSAIDSSLKINADNTGFYSISATQVGFAIAGVLFAGFSNSGLFADNIGELTPAAGVTIDGVLLKDSTIALSDGVLANLAIKIGADSNNGIYGVSDVQLGFAVEGLLVAGCDTSGLFTSVISEQTATTGVTIDGLLVKDGSASFGTSYVRLHPIAAKQALVGAGAITLTEWYSTIDTNAGAAAFTLANGTVVGQVKKIQMIIDGGDGTLTPTSLSGGTTITFADAGDFAILMWNGTAWVAIELGNDADGITAPVLA